MTRTLCSKSVKCKIVNIYLRRKETLLIIMINRCRTTFET